MIIPEFFLTLFFLVFRNPRLKDKFYPKYYRYLVRKGLLEVYDFSNLAELTDRYPTRVKIEQNKAIFFDVALLKNGYIRLDKKTYFINDFHAYYLFVKGLSNYRKVKTQNFLPEAVSMCGMYSDTFNLFHFLSDSLLPNIGIRREEASPTAVLPAIRNDLQKDLLHLTSIKDWVEVGQGIQVGRLQLNRTTPKWDKRHYENFRFEYCNIEKVIQEKQSAAAGKLIYATRAGNVRNYKNEQQLINLLFKYNFIVVDFGKMSLGQRRDLLSETAIFISQYGAGLSNMVFMNPGASVIDLQLGNLVRNDYCLMASACDLNYINVPFVLRSTRKTYNYSLSKDDLFHVEVALKMALQ